MPRTMLELENALPQLDLVPYSVAPTTIDTTAWWREPVTVRLLAMEYLKYLAVLLRTSVEGDPERSPAANLMSGFRFPTEPAPAAAI